MKKQYERPDAQIVNLAALSRIALIEDPVAINNDYFDGSISTDEDRD